MNAFTVGLLIFLGMLLLTALVLLVRRPRPDIDRARQDIASADAEYRAGPRYNPPFGPGPG